MLCVGCFTLCLRVGGLSGAEPKPDAEPPPHLILKLRDGSRLVGSPKLDKLPFQSNLATADIPMKGIRSVEFSDTGDTANMTFGNGDHLKGSFKLDSIEMETLVGKVSIAIRQISSLRVSRGGSAPVAEGLIGHWPLDGNAEDTSGNGHHGTVHGAVAIEEGKIGGAYRFDGSSGIDVGNLDLSGGKFTVSCWIRSDRAAVREDWRNWIGKITDPGGGPFTFFLGDGRKDGGSDGPTFHSWQGGTGVVNIWTGKSNFRDGKWHMVTGTYEAGHQKLYADGILDCEGTYSGALPTNAGGVIIGGSNFGPYHHPWIGDIDEVLIYNRALSASEVESIQRD